MTHKLAYVVIFGDTDAGGIVYHPRYLEMAERGRNEAGRAAGLDVGELFSRRQTGLALRRAEMSFHSPAVFDDHLTIHTHVEKVGAAMASWVSRIQRGTHPICTVRAEIICMDREKHEPQMFPADVRDAMSMLTLNSQPARNNLAEATHP